MKARATILCIQKARAALMLRRPMLALSVDRKTSHCLTLQWSAEIASSKRRGPGHAGAYVH
jgi:hypothetical protein